MTSIYLVFAAITLALGLLLPSRFSPSIALLGWCLVPIAYFDLPIVLSRYAHPSVILLGLWAITGRNGTRIFPRVGALLIGSVLILSTLGSIELQRSLLWFLNFGILVLLVPSTPLERARAAYGPLLVTLRIVTIGLGAFAILERAIRANPFAAHYLINGRPIGQRWSVYRVETLLGHPLMNSAFFVCMFVLFMTMSARSLRWLDVAAAIFAAVGLWFTGSRSALLAALIGLILILIVISSRRDFSIFAKVSAWLGATIATATVIAHGLPDVRSSTEGQISTQYRGRVIDLVGGAVSGHRWLGSGPGTSQVDFDRLGLQTVIESSALQLFVSIGLVGATAVTLFLVVQQWQYLRRRAFSASIAIVAFLVQISGFNAIDSIPSVMILFATLSIVALATMVESHHDEPNADSAARQSVGAAIYDGPAPLHDAKTRGTPTS